MTHQAMRAYADTHLHLYPDYDIDAALANFVAQLPDDGTGIACLAERHDCDFFTEIVNDTLALPSFEVTAKTDNEATLHHLSAGKQLSLLPGRQIITSENIEVLALVCRAHIPDGLPAEEVIESTNAQGGVAVLPWSPGKWFFSRGKLVAHLIEQFGPQQLLIGDTTLRPTVWPMPRLIRHAQKLGYSVVAGSDPLPFAGEERWFGNFHSLIEGNATTAGELVRGLLTKQTQCLNNRGKRSQPLELLYRLKANANSKGAAPA